MRLDAEGIGEATVAQIEAFLARRGGAGRRLLAVLEQDERIAVRSIAVRERTRWRQRQKERQRQRSMRDLEQRFRAEGAGVLAGVDEVGRGCLAGPVVAAAVILPPGAPGLEALDDSKALDAPLRSRLRDHIVEIALDWSVAEVDAGEIDRINILEASMMAMRRALASLRQRPDRVLVDGNRAPVSGLPETALVGGDARSLSIAAASVVAKHHRDALMIGLDASHPGYDFASNKGYASPTHRSALKRLGPCPLHRRSFQPLAGDQQLRLDLDRPPTVGDRGERAAERYLRQQGYEILTRSYRGAGGEIDLIARHESTFVFVEVKSAGARAAAARGVVERVDARKRRHLKRAAEHYIEWQVRLARPNFRFDVVAVDLSGPKPAVDHIEDAFDVSTA